MFQQEPTFFIESSGFIIPRRRIEGLLLSPGSCLTRRTETRGRLCSYTERAGGLPEDTDATLDEAARSEREYVRGRLREELKREPTEQELDEWLRQHTEGY